jgi:hypothetical protein
VIAIITFLFGKHSLKDFLGEMQPFHWIGGLGLLAVTFATYLWFTHQHFETEGPRQPPPEGVRSPGGGPEVPYQADSHTVALWHFNEISGRTTPDETGGHTGVVQGTPSPTPGLFGNALTLGAEGSGSYITVSDADELDGFPQVTVEAWIYPRGGAANMDLVGKGQHTGNAADQVVFPYDLATAPTSPGFPSGLRYSFFVGGAGGSIEADSETHPFNTWLYLAGTYDGHRARIYVNGQQEGESSTMDGMVWTNGNPLFINNQEYPTASGMIQSNGGIAGVFDEIRISNTARSADEIADIYRKAVPQ